MVFGPALAVSSLRIHKISSIGSTDAMAVVDRAEKVTAARPGPCRDSSGS
jgi:hypothetical protein